MSTQLSFIRGINVGGRNIIKMEFLRDALTSEGFEEVKTYIQTGNILFQSKESKADDLKKHSEKIEKCLKKHFDIDTKVVTFTADQWQLILEEAPNDWGEKENWRHNLIILLEGNAKKILEELGEVHPEIESAVAGKSAIYHSVLQTAIGKSRYSRVPGLPLYQEVTIRNANTANKLLALCQKSS